MRLLLKIRRKAQHRARPEGGAARAAATRPETKIQKPRVQSAALALLAWGGATLVYDWTGMGWAGPDWLARPSGWFCGPGEDITTLLVVIKPGPGGMLLED